MTDFNNEELKLIHDFMRQIAWKIGESKKLILAENIVKVCAARIIPEKSNVIQESK